MMLEEQDNEEQSSNATDDGSNMADSSDAEEEQFDIRLAATHSYLSPEGLTVVPGRALLEPGWRAAVPCVAHRDVVFPGETVPMLFSHNSDMDEIRQAIDTDRLFCLLFPDENGHFLANLGVVCEVLEHGTVGGALTVRARAAHRVRHSPLQPALYVDHMRVQRREVCVLEETYAREPLHAVRLGGLHALRRSLPAELCALDACLTPWPAYLYDMFSPSRNMAAIRQHFSAMVVEKLPLDAVSLSFWSLANLPLSPRDRLAVFRIDDTLLRLHIAVSYIQKASRLCCRVCGCEVARTAHALSMSSEGPHTRYTNAAGYLHDVVTLSHVHHVRPQGPLCTDFTWFPGYGWTILNCERCHSHLGWRYEAVKKNLRPQEFYGLCRLNMKPCNDVSDDEL